MGLKLSLVLLLLAMAAVPLSSSFKYYNTPPIWGPFHGPDSTIGASGEFLDGAEKFANPMVAPARHLAERKYLSYGALRKNNVPCGQRGNSYYNCRKRQAANPYRRGCSVITRCARFTD